MRAAGADGPGPVWMPCWGLSQWAGAGVNVLSSKAVEVASKQSLDQGQRDGAGGRSLTAWRKGIPGRSRGVGTPAWVLAASPLPPSSDSGSP